MASKEIEHQRRAKTQQRAKEANTELRVTKKRGSDHDRQCDCGPFAVVANIGMLSPEIIIGFVWRKFVVGDQEQPNYRKRQQKNKEQPEASGHGCPKCG